MKNLPVFLWTLAMWKQILNGGSKLNSQGLRWSVNDIFREFVMLCQFLLSYNRKLVGIKGVLATEEVRLDNSQKSIKDKRKNWKNLNIEWDWDTKKNSWFCRHSV